MDSKKFKLTWGRLQRDGLAKNVVIAVLLVFLGIALMGWFSAHETTVLVPPQLDERVSISRGGASETYQKKWGLFIAELTGNVHPGNVKVVQQWLAGYLSPDVYQEWKEVFASQVQDIIKDNLTVSFEPKNVTYERETGKVFVTGELLSKGAVGEPHRALRTFELRIEVRFGEPWVTFFTAYNGEAKTIPVRERERSTNTTG